MKVLAAKNDPTRRLQEMADIVELMRACRIDPITVRQYFARNALRMSVADIVVALEQFGALAASELRARPGPRGEPFSLAPD